MIADIAFRALFVLLAIMAWLTLLFSISRNRWPVTLIVFLLMCFSIGMVFWI